MRALNLALFALLLIGIDQVSKAFVAQNFRLSDPPLPLFLGFHTKYTHNTGAAFSLFHGNAFALGIVSLVVSIGIIAVLMIRRRQISLFHQIVMMLILAGALGNMIDRLFIGYVRDFIYFSITRPKFDFAIFNFADSFVVVGAILLILGSFFFERKA